MRRPIRAVTTLVSAAALVATGTATAGAAPARPLSMAAQFGTVAPSASQDTIGDTYPSKWRDIPQDSVVDDWNMYNRECVSWAAFDVAGHGESASNYGNAKDWDDNASQNGYRVDNSPAPGAIAQTDNGTYGHVAIVDSVHDGTATVEDYNWAGDGHYLRHDVNVGDFRYLHFYD